MRKLLPALLAITILALGTAGLAYAHDGEPMFGCPESFDLHMATMDHMDDMDHHHVGLDIEVADINGDGWICMKHVGSDELNHVHIDNNFPFLP